MIISRPACLTILQWVLGLMLATGGALASDEAARVNADFGPLEWIGGVNTPEANNSNGWVSEFEGQPAIEINLSEPHSATGDWTGNVLVADKNAHAIRQIDRHGNIRTVAGTNTAGFNGDGPALTCHLNGPQNAYPMPDGSFYIMDTGNKRIRRVDADGQMTTVIIETSSLSRGLWVKRDSSLIYYCTNTALKRWTSSSLTVMAENFSELGNLDVAQNGDIYLTDRGVLASDPTFSKVFRITPDATPATYTPVAVAGIGGSTDSGSAAGGSMATTVGIRGVRGIAFHPAGGYFLATHKGGDLWYVDRSGIITMMVEGNDANTNTPFLLPRTLPAVGSAVVSELRSVSVAVNGDLLIATNDAGFILRARYQGPNPVSMALRVKPPVVRGGPVRMEWTLPAGRWFRLESASDPASQEWVTQFTAVDAVGGSILTWTDPTLPAMMFRQFYRLREFRDWPN